MRKQFNLLKQLGSLGKTQDATDLLTEDLVLVEQRVEPTKKAAQIIHKKLSACLQSQTGLDAEKRTKKLPLMMLSMSMAESLKDFDGDSPIRRVLEMCCFMQTLLAKTLADFEVQLEKEVLEPLNKLSEEDLPEILKNKKQFAKLTTDWLNARSRSQASSGPQAKQDGLREEVEEAWRKLESAKDQYSADLYHFSTKQDEYSSYFTRLLELQADYHQKSLSFLERNITELKENHSQSGPLLGGSFKPVYGQPLLSHLLDSGRQIATPIQECVHMLLNTGMQEEGLFRLAAAASVVKRLKHSLDSSNVDHSEFSSDPHAVAGALKSYLRELPEPLMTFDLYDEWFKAVSERELSDRLERIREVLKKLPLENYNNLRYLIQFLARLSEQQAVNKMTPSNVAIVLGPNLLWPKMEGENVTFDMASASSVQVVSVIEPLIQHAGSLFPEEVDFMIPELPGNSDLTSSQSLPCVADPHSHTDPSITPLTDSSSLSQNISEALSQLSSIGNSSSSDSKSRHPVLTSHQSPAASSGSHGPPHHQAAAPSKAWRPSLQQKPFFQPRETPKGNEDFCKPSGQSLPPAQGEEPLVPTIPCDHLSRKPPVKKGTVKCPSFPPPNPPQLINKHLSFLGQ
ncbi:SH3 domain-binding protein 1-like isoform X2 [Brienomyrus brachyistius]|uniref:SH3 domain-binding protein 1-like isoform X2 n=1 Tax=Brienomyrus brachyistius TaxID=42636 RepID=UPI0020B29059|nr:SH3 domain-binding protein 1-like isoform X2 [Brienomyrus brachyistius]